MRIPDLSVFEHASVSVEREAGPNVLSEDEADRLDLLTESKPGLCTRGYRNVKFAQYCGIASLGDRAIEILPKVGEVGGYAESRDVLLRLLRASQDSSSQRLAAVGQGLGSAPLMEVFIKVFFDEIAALMKGGLLRRYRELEEDCLAVRGSILLRRQLTTLANRPDRIACRFDDLTADNRWNRLIKAGLSAVRPWLRSYNLQRTWVELMSAFDEVSDAADAHALLASLQYDRQGGRYRPAIGWVERILNFLAPNLRAGRKHAPGLLFDMNRLFESVVTERMRSLGWKHQLSVEAQNDSKPLAHLCGSPGRAEFRLRPDVLFTDRGSPVAIADAKWKRPKLDRDGVLVPAEADVYQIHAYSAAWKCQHLALVYPWDEQLQEARPTLFNLPANGDRRPQLAVLCLDIGRDDLPLRLGSGFWAER
ncbi:MAG: hypothetical protein KBG39_07645 [Opitutaceae bacterium]|nr:hypothetical protein [Opitutaceae bacterium]